MAESARKKLNDSFGAYAPEVAEKILRPAKIFSSPMERAVATAEILFPDSEIVTVDGLREIRMGLFENMSHEELSSGLFADGSKSEKNSRAYQSWIDSKGMVAPPGSGAFKGESMDEFVSRVSESFRKIVSENELGTFVIVAHGGVQMVICSTMFFKAKLNDISYFKWQSENVGYRFGTV